MFDAIGAKTLFIFGACNFITIPMVWALYPESNQRTLEEMDLLFASDSVWNWEAEKHFKLMRQQNPDLLHGSRRGATGADPEMQVSVERKTATDFVEHSS